MKLFLKNGRSFAGKSFGAPVSAAGEVVFNTGMVGYVESLSDPSYAGQILVYTYPLIGNYGVPDEQFFESTTIQAAGLVVGEYNNEYSHHAARESLGSWLKRSGVPALTGVDTRAITIILREKGVMLGQLGTTQRTFVDPNKENLVARVSIRRRREYGEGKIKIIMVDCGMKENIVRSLMRPDNTLVRVPFDYDFTKEKYDGLFISNGPGNPAMCTATIANLKKALKRTVPILGICLGNQLLALASGATTYKLKYGHRAQNLPCLIEGGTRCYITSQNHGYAVDENTLPKEWKSWFVNAHDGSNEGIRHISKPWRAVQFHPEAAPGPSDTRWIFDEFLKDVVRNKKRNG